MSDVPTFAALCADCGKPFAHPELSDFSYGECIFYTLDGKHYARANVFVGDAGAFAQRVSTLHKRCKCEPGTFWPVLASLADPVAGKAFTSSIRCPHCGSKNLASWGGKKVGSASVAAASFRSSMALSDQEIIERAVAISHATVLA